MRPSVAAGRSACLAVGQVRVPVYDGAMSIDPIWRTAIEDHQAGRLDAAARGYRAVLEQEPGHAAALHRLGILAYQAGDTVRAIELVGQSLARDPDSAEAHNTLGLALQRAGRLQDAIMRFERATALKPDFADAYYHLAVVARQAGLSERAETAYRAAIARDARFASAYLELGAMLQAERRLDEAAAVYGQALAVRDDYAPILSNLALVRHQQGRLDEAILLLERAAAADPRSAELQTNLGILLQERGRLDAAGAALEHALALKPDYVPAHSHSGLLLHELGRDDAAIACFHRVLALRPGDEEASYMIAVLTGQRLDSAPAGYVTRLFDQYAARFDDHLVGTLRYRVPEDLAGLIASLDRGGMFETTLDIGCGTGLSGLPFRPLARRLIGVDLSARMLERARARSIYDALHEADALAFIAGFAGAIDLVVAADLLVYLGDPAPLLGALAAKQPPGGLIALSVEGLEAGRFALNPDGRFSHNPDHIAAVGAGCGYALAARRATVIRQERRAPAHGALLVLQKI